MGIDHREGCAVNEPSSTSMLVPCGGSRHKVTVDVNGMRLRRHDVAAEDALVALGLTAPPCLRLLSAWQGAASSALGMEAALSVGRRRRVRWADAERGGWARDQLRGQQQEARAHPDDAALAATVTENERRILLYELLPLPDTALLVLGALSASSAAAVPAEDQTMETRLLLHTFVNRVVSEAVATRGWAPARIAARLEREEAAPRSWVFKGVLHVRVAPSWLVARAAGDDPVGFPVEEP